MIKRCLQRHTDIDPESIVTVNGQSRGLCRACGGSHILSDRAVRFIMEDTQEEAEDWIPFDAFDDDDEYDSLRDIGAEGPDSGELPLF